jgi:hypothetical protein
MVGTATEAQTSRLNEIFVAFTEVREISGATNQVDIDVHVKLRAHPDACSTNNQLRTAGTASTIIAERQN